MKRFFHSPFFLLVILVFCRCTKSETTEAENPKELQRLGYEARTKAVAFHDIHQLDSAFTYYNKAKELYIRAKDSANTAYVLLKTCEILYEYNDYDELQTTAVEALHYLNTKRDTAYLPSVYTHLERSFAMSEDLKNAEIYYRLGKRYASTDFEKATFDNNFAHANILQGNFDKAFEILSAAKTKYNLSDTLPIKAKILDNYGFSAFKAHRKVDGDPMALALELRKRNNDTNGLITSYLNLAEVELSSNRDSSLAKAMLAEKIAKENKSAYDRLEVLRFLVKNADAPASKKYAIDFVRLDDSLKSASGKAKNSFALIKYNFWKEREKRIQDEARHQLEKQDERFVWTLLLLVLTIAILWLVAYFVRRSKRIKRKASYDTEVRISGRLHDDLANDVHRTIVFAETNDLSDKENKETLLNRLDTIYSGTRSISHDHGEIPHQEDFGNYLRALLQEYNSDERAVLAQGIQSVNWQKIERFKRIELSRVIQELLTNMRKHSDCSHSFFAFGQSGKKVRITYSDNGKGTTDDTQKRKNGLRIMENRISGLGGTATFDSEPGKGFRAEIEISI
ncbi:hypothetical protein HUK80_02105 [Flavobacterium sp. MAH-1]|uniref:histidine kinase n=1 Tax=Flavobacterium agri TaxID=2743471 RepID=A0A7Y8XZA5_9FLAO|nr:ATP-binding protein [Flavobacterium agri]NUY79674.1 hypothetical protein [Flavobacterium agri]NYA69699.1 hypothetical protein [Flavobacterium agri]